MDQGDLESTWTYFCFIRRGWRQRSESRAAFRRRMSSSSLVYSCHDSFLWNLAFPCRPHQIHPRGLSHPISSFAFSTQIYHSLSSCWPCRQGGITSDLSCEATIYLERHESWGFCRHQDERTSSAVFRLTSAWRPHEAVANFQLCRLSWHPLKWLYAISSHH